MLRRLFGLSRVEAALEEERQDAITVDTEEGVREHLHVRKAAGRGSGVCSSVLITHKKADNAFLKGKATKSFEYVEDLFSWVWNTYKSDWSSSLKRRDVNPDVVDLAADSRPSRFEKPSAPPSLPSEHSPSTVSSTSSTVSSLAHQRRRPPAPLLRPMTVAWNTNIRKKKYFLYRGVSLWEESVIRYDYPFMWCGVKPFVYPRYTSKVCAGLAARNVSWFGGGGAPCWANGYKVTLLGLTAACRQLGSNHPEVVEAKQWEQRVVAGARYHLFNCGKILYVPDSGEVTSKTCVPQDAVILSSVVLSLGPKPTEEKQAKILRTVFSAPWVAFGVDASTASAMGKFVGKFVCNTVARAINGCAVRDQ
eukprot:GHVQ01035573.1.p1 GENE.GHVQ01035573.1~~GHVQ01035573.1.p1  ORF type:complete len:364 (+),score=38.47 GHVQ01035573.1:1321-2412(+)